GDAPAPDPGRRADRQRRPRHGRQADAAVPVAEQTGRHRADRQPRRGPGGAQRGGRPAAGRRTAGADRRAGGGRVIGPLRRSEPDLLPREAGGERWLVVVIAVLCFLASIAAVGALAADRAAHGWARQLRAEATVQVRPRVDETGPAAAARAAETLAGVKGVAEAEALDRKAAEGLLRPWVGEAALPDLPLPHLVVVHLDPQAPASAPSLSRALAEAGLDASVDDHSLWRGEVERAAGVITALAGTAFLLIAAATGAAIAYATRAGLAAQAAVIETL